MIQTTLHQAFRALPDPRVERGKRHNLLDIIILSILAVLSGAESYDSIELFGKQNLAFLKQFLKEVCRTKSKPPAKEISRYLIPVNWKKDTDG
jgi:hypothetical protein